MASALETAAKIAANAPLVIQPMKSIARSTPPKSSTELYYPQRAMLDGIANSADLKEGVASFREAPGALHRCPESRHINS